MILAISMLTAACASGEPGADDATPAGPPVSGRSLETFEGDGRSLPALAGEPLVVNFWASWCPPCVAEMPDFEQVHLARQDEIRFIGLDTQDNFEQADRLREQAGVTYDLGLDPEGALFADFEVIRMPGTCFVDPQVPDG